MAAAVPGSSSISLDMTRPEAGPLPSKRGEIGFVDGLHVQQDSSTTPSSPGVNLPARHPADRDAVAATTVPSTPDPNSENSPSIIASSTTSLPSTTTSTTESNIQRKRILGFIKAEKVPAFGGLRLTTLLIFVLQVVVFGGTIAGWVLAVGRLSNLASNNQQSSGAASTSVFIHVIFVVATLAQLLFLERRIFRLRAERYSHVHPGEVLPRYRHGGSHPAIAFAPWSRPPLPTYAAALAQSGVGTGDVEDHMIAAPPPPAYGNTRGSTLLLAGFLRESLRAQRPVSGQTQMSQREERPASYASRDERWEEMLDADRARQLEETLARLERPTSRV